MDISRALDGNERSSMRPLFEIFDEHFGHLCSYRDSLGGDGRYLQFGAFEITIAPINHPRNDALRRRGLAQREAEDV